MKIADFFKNNEKTVFSFEVFPPKKDSPIESVYSKMEELCALKPDFISVTYGAGYFDMMAYEKYNDGVMTDYIPTDEDLKPGFDGIPKFPGNEF